MDDLQQAEREPCEGRVCSGSGCSHERAAFELIADDQAERIRAEILETVNEFVPATDATRIEQSLDALIKFLVKGRT